MPRYLPIPASRVPSGVRFDVPRRNAGRFVERAFGGFSRWAHDDGAPFMRVTDTTTKRVTYYQLA